jgi:chromosome partitioning protein
MKVKTLAVAQQKGGVGKTTTAINLGAALAELKKKVLVVDFDPQGALTAGLGLQPDSLSKSIYSVIRSDAPLSEIITSIQAGIDLIPANIDLSGLEIELVNETGREYFLRDKLAEIADRYEYIIIDCPPSLGLLTINALTAASGVIVPVQTQYFALRGMDLLFDLIKKIRSRVNRDLSVVGILPTLFDARTTHGREVLEELKRTYPGLVFNTVIPSTVKFPDSTMAGTPILSISPQSAAAEAYRELAKEIEANG